MGLAREDWGHEQLRMKAWKLERALRIEIRYQG